MEKLSHLHKYLQPCALAIREAWLDDRAPDGRVVSGSFRAFTMDREVGAVGEHNNSGVCCPIRNQPCKSAVAMEMLHSPQNAFLVAQAQLFAPGFTFYPSVQAAGKYIIFISNSIFRPDCSHCYLELIR